VHQWDEQRDLLMYIDEEFFNVAHLLLDVVGRDPDNLDRYRPPAEPVAREVPETGGLRLLSRFFGCSAGKEVDLVPPRADGPRRYLTEKLVRDFHAAVVFRAGRLDPDPAADDAAAARTREVARQVAAYGLPLLPSGRAAAFDHDPEKESEEGVDEELLATFHLNQGKDQQFFPVLPVCEDEERGADENDPRLAKQHLGVSSHDTAHSAKQSISASICSSLFKLKSAMPSEEDCKRRLIQIDREILKAQQMVRKTTNKSVQAACQKRVANLKDERRFFQIVQERHKIQVVMETTRVPFVRSACRERFRQLMLELTSLRYGQGPSPEEDEEDAGAAAEGPASDAVPRERTGPTGAPRARAGGNEKPIAKPVTLADRSDDTQWYDAVLRYLGERPLHEEIAAAKSARRKSPRAGEPSLSLEQNRRGNAIIGSSLDQAAKSTESDDSQWFERVMQYVTGEPCVSKKRTA